MTVCWMIWHDNVILCFLVSNVYFNYIVQNSLYHNMDKGTMWHCALVSCTPSQSVRLFFVCVVLVLSVIMCSFYLFLDRVLFHHDSCDYHWDFYGHHFHSELHFRLSKASSSGTANAHLPGYFRPWTLPLNIGLNMLHSDTFISCLDSLVGYSTGEFLSLQLIVLAVFGAVD